MGSGYVGTVVATCLATVGHDVVGVELDDGKLQRLQAGAPFFYEPGLDEFMRAVLLNGRLRFTGSMQDALHASNAIFLCVGTPEAPDGTADMSAVAFAAEQIGRLLDCHHVLVTKSTVPIGSGKWLASIIAGALPPHVRREDMFSVVANPEFLREGSAIKDFLHPDRVVLGSDDRSALELVGQIYRPLLDQAFPGGSPNRRPPLVFTTLATAETIKYASNAFLATKISFINEMANICELVGADVSEVATALGLDARIGAQFLEAGVGWGGSCFGKDLGALTATAAKWGYCLELLPAVLAVNYRQRRLVVEKVRRHLGTLEGRRISLLGLAFKPGTDDLRDAPSIAIARWLQEEGAMVSAHDPVVRKSPELTGVRISSDPYDAVEGADAVILVTEWPEYLALNFEHLSVRMCGKVFIDGRNLLDSSLLEQAGLRYEGIGRARSPHLRSDLDCERRSHSIALSSQPEVAP